MRINHTGEVCAQALYQGQALTAKLPQVRIAMEHAAEEEVDHLAWCEQRIHQLGSHTSILNPLFYGMSFGIGAVAGLISDKVSLGFVAATEDQVCKHLNEHLEQLPAEDEKSRAILEQMRIDEEQHAESALEAGGFRFPAPVKFGMSLMAKAGLMLLMGVSRFLEPRRGPTPETERLFQARASREPASSGSAEAAARIGELEALWK